MKEALDAMKRAEYLLGIVRRFIAKNPITEYTVFYDDAVCDGSCLAEDCDTAAEEIRIAIAREEGR